MAITYQLIASSRLLSPASTVTFSSIPSTYSDLLLKGYARGTTSGVNGSNFSIRPNNYTTNTYGNVFLTESGSAQSAGTLNNATYGLVRGVLTSGASSAAFSTFEMYLPNYQSSLYKSFGTKNSSGTRTSTGSHVSLTATSYGDTNAVTSLTLLFSSDQIDTYSAFYLYGINNS
jgi:hypothetical protein